MTAQKLTYEELLEVEKSLQTYLEFNGIRGVMLENVKMTASAIEKQVAKQIEIWNGQASCPNCKILFGNVTDFQHMQKRLSTRILYCKECGQKIDWSEFDETHQKDIRGCQTNTSGISTNKKQRRSFIFKGLRKNKLY